ncbi:MAG: hypothetical protein WBB39_02075 [Candidatus Saccharimonadales bacterium]
MSDRVSDRNAEWRSPHDVLALLSGHDIDVSSWGTGGSKRVEDLMAEIEAGEAAIIMTEAGLVRRVDGVAIDVLVEVDGKWLQLIEDKQVFMADGTERKRNLSTSLGEKRKAGESAVSAMVRALKEELGIDVSEEDFMVGEELRQLDMSRSYQGLMTDRGLTYGVILLPPGSYRPEGYVEHQSTKYSLFSWHEVTIEPTVSTS